VPLPDGELEVIDNDLRWDEIVVSTAADRCCCCSCVLRSCCVDKDVGWDEASRRLAAAALPATWCVIALVACVT
jgi:hypothetical protein